jgi:hypothetical protein
MGSGARRALGLVLAAILCLSAGVRAEEAPVSEVARSHFKIGLRYLNDPAGPRYEDALREFSAAHAAAPSSWKTLNNIGLCALNLERDQEAIDAYEQALALAGSSAESKWRDSVQRDIATLKAGLVRVTIMIRPASAVLLDERLPTSGRAVLNRYTSPSGTFVLGIHAGRHRISAILGGKTDVWEFDATAGAAMSHHFSLEEPMRNAGPSQTGPAQVAPTIPKKQSVASPARSTPPGVYVAGSETVDTKPGKAARGSPGLRLAGLGVAGAGVVGLGIGGFFGLRALGQKADSEPACNGQDQCTTQAGYDARKSAVRSASISTIAFVAGGVLAAGGITLYLVGQPGNSQHASHLTVTPAVLPVGASVWLTGRF